MTQTSFRVRRTANPNSTAKGVMYEILALALAVTPSHCAFKPLEAAFESAQKMDLWGTVKGLLNAQSALRRMDMADYRDVEDSMSFSLSALIDDLKDRYSF